MTCLHTPFSFEKLRNMYECLHRRLCDLREWFSSESTASDATRERDRLARIQSFLEERRIREDIENLRRYRNNQIAAITLQSRRRIYPA
jgi:hypothetical protein